MRPAEAQSAVEAVIDTTLVPHTAFQFAMSALDQSYARASKNLSALNNIVIGESRTGKTTVLDEFAAKYPSVREECGLRVPILKVRVPSKPTVKSLAELMLRAIGDPKFDVGTENVKTMRLQILIARANTKMLMFDEFQHFYDKASHKVMHHVADWIKNLAEDAGVCLTVAGLSTSRAVLDQNEQLSGRFQAPIVMPRFDWRDGEDREEFIAILEAFHAAISRHFDMPAMARADMPFRWYCATGGLIGYVTNILRRAISNTGRAGLREITLADLARAHEEAVWGTGEKIRKDSPFSRAFGIDNLELRLTQAAVIGTRIAPELPRVIKAKGMGLSIAAALGE